MPSYSTRNLLTDTRVYSMLYSGDTNSSIHTLSPLTHSIPPPLTLHPSPLTNSLQCQHLVHCSYPSLTPSLLSPITPSFPPPLTQSHTHFNANSSWFSAATRGRRTSSVCWMSGLRLFLFLSTRRHTSSKLRIIYCWHVRLGLNLSSALFPPA